MILIDTGPFVALFDPRDGQRLRCKTTLKGIQEPLTTTVPVLMEAFHMLGPASHGSSRLREFILRGGVSVWFMDQPALARCFELMDQYSNHPNRPRGRISRDFSRRFADPQGLYDRP